VTTDERNMLADLANKIAQTPAPPKDAEAEEFIRSKIGSRPDALYLMTQTVLIQNLALQNAQQQIQDLQQRASQPAPVASGGSFLGGQGSAPRPGGYSSSQYSGSPQYAAPPPQYAPAPPQYAQAPPQYAPAPGGAPSFLRGAAQTAAGVAAGALAFEGIQALFSHPGYGGGGFGGFGSGPTGLPVEETVVNNYYDTPQTGEDFREDRGDRLADSRDSGDPGNVMNADDYQDDTTQDDGGQIQDADYDPGDGGGFDSGDNYA